MAKWFYKAERPGRCPDLTCNYISGKGRMQLNLARPFLKMITRRILEETFPGETGASRLQQIGLFTLILSMEDEHDNPPTATRLAALTKQSESQIARMVRKL